MWRDQNLTFGEDLPFYLFQLGDIELGTILHLNKLGDILHFSVVSFLQFSHTVILNVID